MAYQRKTLMLSALLAIGLSVTALSLFMAERGRKLLPSVLQGVVGTQISIESGNLQIC